MNNAFIEPKRVEKVYIAKHDLLDEVKEHQVWSQNKELFIVQRGRRSKCIKK